MKTNPNEAFPLKEARLVRRTAAVVQWAGVLILLLFLSHVCVYAQTPPSYNILDSFSFSDTNNWVDDNGDSPNAYTNIVGLPGPYDNSMFLDTTNLVPAYLNYPVYVDDWTNLYPNTGTILFWVEPNWSSTNGGAGPGDWGRFVETGEYTTNASVGWLSIYCDSGGDTIYFSGQTNNGNGLTYLSYPISWASNAWHNVALSYSPTGSTLFLDGITVTNGLGVAYYPGTNVLANGLWIGSDYAGSNQARALFSDIMILDSPINSNDVAGLIIPSSMGFDYGSPLFLIANAPSNPQVVPPSYNAITGTGNLTNIGSASFCINGTNGYNVWITNVVATKVVSGTNLTMDLSFSIEGGDPGIPYDVFASSVLDSTNEVTWAWEGQGYQCERYMLTNLPSTTCYLILGTPQDSDGDGLTDAYEYLVSHTNPDSADSAGDGISDLVKVLAGVNPNTVYPAIPPGFTPQTCPP